MATFPPALELFERRARMLAAIRAFFVQRGFLEVETPARVVCPGLEPHLRAIGTTDGRWLRTSPELHLKRLVAGGIPRLFELARCFRGDERGPWHLTEFTLLEWYRAGQSLDAIATDVEALLLAVAGAAGSDPRSVAGCDLTSPAESLTVREAVLRHAGVDLAQVRERGALASVLQKGGIATSPDDSWDDLFFRLFLSRVEPHLGRGRITILSEYPASQAALAKVRPDPEWPVALRFEVYWGGVELANAFDELTDPIEQRRRHEADRIARARAGQEIPPLDAAFLAALEDGLPDCAGIALGVERLIALVLGLPGARDGFPFGAEQ